MWRGFEALMLEDGGVNDFGRGLDRSFHNRIMNITVNGGSRLPKLYIDSCVG